MYINKYFHTTKLSLVHSIPVSSGPFEYLLLFALLFLLPITSMEEARRWSGGGPLFFAPAVTISPKMLFLLVKATILNLPEPGIIFCGMVTFKLP